METARLQLFTCILLLIIPALCSAAIITVTNTNDNGAGSLRQAVINANPGDEIQFSSSLNGSLIALDSAIRIEKTLTITGNGIENTFLDGGKNDRVLFIPSGSFTVNISGLVVQNGQVEYNGAVGGGIIAAANVTFTNCWIRGNAANNSTPDSQTRGGGLSCSGNTTLINCIVSGNSCLTDGGGIYCGSGELTLINTTVAENRSLNYTASGIIDSEAGGIFFGGGSFYTFTMRNSVVWGNEAISNKQIVGTIDIVDHSIVEGIDLRGSGINNLDGTNPANDPYFINDFEINIPNTGGDYRLLPKSNLIDAGGNSYNSTAQDIYAVGRTFDGNMSGTSTIDIGAAEFNNYPGMFITQWTTTNSGLSANNEITIPTAGFSSYNYTVQWGDGTSTTTTSSSDLTHTYAFSGTYNVIITGLFPRILFNGFGDKDKIEAILHWGENPWTSMSSAFKGCSNLEIQTPWSPNLSNMDDMSQMFRNASSVNNNFENWDVSNIKTMTGLFEDATNFNGEIGNWDVSNVTSFARMFDGATDFDRDIGAWNTQSATDMGAMFRGAVSFNQDIGNWDVSNVIYFIYMFTNNPVFNQDIGNWNTESGNSFAHMFENATAFDQDIGAWDISGINQNSIPPASVAECVDMFTGAGLSVNNYDQLLIGWNRLDPGEARIPTGVILDAGSSQYCAGAGARDNLLSNYSWTISDAGGLVNYDTIIVSTCATYTVPSGDETLTMTGTYLDTLPNSQGCDSIITIELTILNSSYIYSVNDCDSFTVPSGDETYFVSGTYMDTIPNVAGCDSILTINLTIDGSPPNANCRDITLYLDANGEAAVPSAAVDDGSTDNCGIDTIYTVPDIFYCYEVGSKNVDLFVVDVNGNSSSCNAKLTVLDTTAPVAVCQDVTVSLDAAGNGTLSVNDVDAGSFDNCGIDSRTLNIISFDCSNVGDTTVTLTVTDKAGNSNSCTATITVQDALPPLIECQDVNIYLDSTGVGDFNPITNGALISVTDNCVIVPSGTQSGPGINCNNIGPSTLTIFWSDVNGNSSNCAYTGTITDTIAPTAICQDITVSLNANGQVTISPAMLEASSWDNCSISSRTLNQSTFDCADIGNNSVQLTVSDPSGNSSTCSATVTVEDNTPPTVLCQDVTVSLDANGEGNITVDDVDAGSTDNCGIASRSLDRTNFDCSQTGNQSVTLTVTDNNGLSSSCTATVTVEDNISPTPVCNDVTVSLDANGQFSDTIITEIGGGSFDNCGILSMGGTYSFDCNDLGDNTVTFNVVDNSLNYSSCQPIITVIDDIPPTALCQDITVSLNSSGTASIDSSFINNGSSDNCSIVEINLDQTDFDCSHTGSNSIVMTVVDQSGNSSTCSATVTISDNIPPTTICQDVTVSLDNTGSVMLSAAQVNDGSFDNCTVSGVSIDRTNFTCADLGDQSVILTVIDGSGNASTCMATVTVEDDIAPTVSCSGDVTLNTSSNGNGDCTAYTQSIGNYDLNDNCPDFIQVREIFQNELGDTIRDFIFDLNSANWTPVMDWPGGKNKATFTPIDGSGNTGASCSYNVTVIDDEAPLASCKDITLQLDDNGEAGLNEYSVGEVNGRMNVQNEDYGNLTTDCDCPDGYVAVGYEGFAGCVVDQFRLICKELLPDGTLGTATAVSCFSSAGSSVPQSDLLSGDEVLVGFEVTDLDYAYAGSRILSSVKGIGKSLSQIVNVEDNATQNTHMPGLVGAGCFSSGPSTTIEYAPAGHVVVGMSVNPNSGYTSAIRFRYAPISNIIAMNNGSADNCGITNATVEPSEFNCSDVGPQPVVYTVWDREGNSSSCNATVTVEDNVPPVAICQDITVFLDAIGNSSITATDIDNGSADSCGIDDLSLNQTDFDCSEIGQNTVVLTVTDVNGNSSTCSASVMVLDTISPEAVCRDITVELDENGNAEIDSSDINNGSFDNCSIVSIELDNSEFACQDVGSNTVILKVTDESGNMHSCSATVMVEDNIPPTPICQDITIELDENGEAAISTLDINNGSFDNCEVASLGLDKLNFDCSNIGSNTVVLTVTDVNGNSSTCQAEVLVEDNIPPTPICQDITIELDENGAAQIGTSDIDNGSFDNCAIDFFELDETDFDCSELGMNTVVLTVWDVNGNSNTCNAEVAVEDNIAPVILSVPADITLECDLPIPSDEPVAEDNCDAIITYTDETIPGRCTGEYLVRRTFTIIDPSGNEAAYKPVREIQFIDTKVPYLISSPSDITLACGSTPPVTLPQVEDNCDPNPSITWEDNYAEDPSCPQGGRIDRVFTISDDCENSYELLQQFYFYDDEMPVIEPLHPDLVNVSNGSTIHYQCYAQDPNWELIEFDLDDFSFSDNCSQDIGQNLTETVIGSGDCMNDGYLAKTHYVITADDGCGNVSSYEFFVELIDAEPPTLIGVPEDITIQCGQAYQYPEVSSCLDEGDVYATDECECADVIESRDTIQGACDVEYSVVVTYLATDNCGNTSADSYTITIEDNTPPEVFTLMPELIGMSSGESLDINCQGAHFPQWALDIGPDTYQATDHCSDSELIDFSKIVQGHEDCFDEGALATLQYRWVFRDECENEVEHNIEIRLIDSTAPVIQLTQSIQCANQGVIYPEVMDNCGEVRSLEYTDRLISDECNGETVIERTWVATDHCGNMGTAIQTVIQNQTLTYDFTVDRLEGAEDGDTLTIECAELEKLAPEEDWISIHDQCFEGGEVLAFNEIIGNIDSLCSQGVLRLDIWSWTLRTICNEEIEVNIYVKVVDRTAPTLVNFEDEIILACGEERPEYVAADVCSSENSVEEIGFEWIDGDSCEMQTYERKLLVSDICGNERVYTQDVLIDGSEGPQISGLPGSVCNVDELFDVKAFDPCSNTEVPVSFDDLPTERCGEAERTLRVYRAESMCGTESLDSVYIIQNDKQAPTYEIVAETLLGYDNGSIVNVQCDGDIRLRDLEFHEHDVQFSDECDPQLRISFEDRTERGNCNVDGYWEKRILQWSASDACGNETVVAIEIRLVDTEAPQFGFVKEEVFIPCGEGLDIDEVIAFDNCSQAVELNFTDGTPQSTERGTEIKRTWMATDGCGNINTITQTIIYEESELECQILPPPIVSCDKNVRISALVDGGTGPYTYLWSVQEGFGDILMGQGTQSILLNIAFSNTELTLLVQDQNGCFSSCATDIICLVKPDRDISRESEKRAYHLYQNRPNPFRGVTTIGFSLPENAEARLQLYSADGKQIYMMEGRYDAGYNEVELRRDVLPSAGMYYYELTSGEFRGVKRMIIVE